MRKVKSTHNFGHFVSQPLAYHGGSHVMPVPYPSQAPIRPSPSMPSFSLLEQQHQQRQPSPAADALPHINEEAEEHPRLNEPLSSMFLDDPDVNNDDLVDLMNDLSDPTNANFDLDLPLDADVGAAPASMPGGTGGAQPGGSGAGVLAPGDSGAMPSDATPSFLHLDGGLGLPPLEEEEFNSAFLDS